MRSGVARQRLRRGHDYASASILGGAAAEMDKYAARLEADADEMEMLAEADRAEADRAEAARAAVARRNPSTTVRERR